MFEIRQATQADVAGIVKMGAAFYEESPYASVKPYNLAGAEEFAKDLVDNHYYLVALKNGEYVGMAAAMISLVPINPDILAASEVVFWVAPAHRGTSVAIRLAQALEEAILNSEDVDVLVMSKLASSPAVVDKLYRKMGYRPTETAYMREVV